MFSFSNIYDVAKLAVTSFGLRSIDWSALGAKGRGSVWDPDYITDYLSPSATAMLAVRATLDLDPNLTADEMKQAYSATASALNSAASSLFSVFGAPVATAQAAFQAEKASVQKVVQMLFDSSFYGYGLHLNETIQHGNFSDAEIAAHASWCCGVMNAVVMLDSLGLYSILGMKTNQPASASLVISSPNSSSTSGLGVAPALIVAGVAVIAILAWALITYLDMNKMNQAVLHMCDQAQASGDQATTQQCITTLASSAKTAATLPVSLVKEILSGIMPYALAGSALYIALLFAPGIVKNIMASKSSTA